MDKINIFDDGGEELQFEESLVRTELKLLGPIFIIFLSDVRVDCVLSEWSLATVTL